DVAPAAAGFQLSEQQCPQPCPRPSRMREAADDELVGGQACRLEPLLVAAWPGTGVATLRHCALESQLARFLENLRAGREAVLGEAERVVLVPRRGLRSLQQLLQRLLPLQERQRLQVATVEGEQIEGLVRDPDVFLA